MNCGDVTLFCNAHPIVVVPTPYFALTSETREYKIENIPDGSYNLSALHEGTQKRPIHLDVGDAKADFSLTQ